MLFSDVLIKIFILFKISFCMKFSRYKSHSSPPCRSIPLTLHFAHGHSPYNLFATALRLCEHIEICVLSLHGSLLSCKWRWRDSNSWPPACKAGALPTELHPQRIILFSLSYFPIFSQLNSNFISFTFVKVRERLRTKFIHRLWLEFIKLLSIRQPPTLPHRLQCSTLGRLSLNHRVRDENGCVP